MVWHHGIISRCSYATQPKHNALQKIVSRAFTPTAQLPDYGRGEGAR